MKVEIKVTATEKELNQAQQARLKRISNVLRENGMEVELVFTPLQVVKHAS
jgi:hypothetical protein